MVEVVKMPRRQTLSEELFNAISHGIGALSAVAATVLMILKSKDAWQVTAVSIYGAAMFVLYMASTLYHSLTNKKAKRVFRVLDHCSIFLLIAGTYTPYTLIALRSTVGWPLLVFIWVSAIVGIVLNAVSLEKFKAFSNILYLLMGWAIVMTAGPLVSTVAPMGCLLLLIGGICYTFGMVFFALGRRIYGMHPLWHVFVLAGSAFQFFSIYVYVLPHF